jgi:hypothetical protein
MSCVESLATSTQYLQTQMNALRVDIVRSSAQGQAETQRLNKVAHSRLNKVAHSRLNKVAHSRLNKVAHSRLGWGRGQAVFCLHCVIVDHDVAPTRGDA